MATQLNFQAPNVDLKKLSSLWFLLTGYNCNLKCKHCYSSCSSTNKKRNSLNLDKVKSTLEELGDNQLEEIYLTGGEPLLHRDINNIIRHCLKYTNVTINTNATLINDKKARFLRQIEDNNSYELIFRVSLDHYNEFKNDDIRGKGSFRRTLSGIGNLISNDFNPIITVVNTWEEDPDSIRQGFSNLFKSKFNFEFTDINLKIIPYLKTGEYAKNFRTYSENEYVTVESIKKATPQNFDCAKTRVITDTGVYVCPALVDDPRGKVGNNLSDAAKKFFLETPSCYTCQEHNSGLFSNDWDLIHY